MAAELIRSYNDAKYGKHTIYVYGCSMCGAEVYLRKRIPGKETYCGSCYKKRNIMRMKDKERQIGKDGALSVINKYLPRVKEILGIKDAEMAAELINGIVKDMEADARN